MSPRTPFAAALMLGVAVCGCAPAASPPPVAAQMAAPVPTPPPVMGQVGLMDYIYGPPPRTRVDPGIRCRFNCPDTTAQRQVRPD